MRNSRTRENLSIDITPLIDVVFLLLIFFMVSTVFKKDELALLLNLPKAKNGEAIKAQKKTIVIELSEEGLAYNGKKLPQEELKDSLKGITDKNTPIDLRIDKLVRYNRIIKVLDVLKASNLTNLSLISER